MTPDPLGLGRRLGARLRPLAVVAGVLISLGLPATYYVFVLSPSALLGATVVLLLASTGVGVALACVTYFYPISVLRGAKAQVDDLITRHETLLAASRLLASTLNLSEVLDRLTEIARSLPGIDVVRIWLRDEQAGGLVCHSQAGVQRFDAEHRVHLGQGQGLTAAVVESGRPVVLRDTLADPRLVNSAWFRAEGLVSYLGVPLKVGELCVGALACMSRAPRDWSRTEIALAETLGTLAAVAIRNARLFGESETRRREAEALAEVGRALAQALDPEVVGQQIADSICSLLGTTTSALFRLEPESGDLVALAVSGSASRAFGRSLVFPRGTGIAGLAVASRQPAVTRDVLNDPRVTLAPEVRARIEEAGYAAVLVVPLTVKDEVIGALGAGDQAGRIFGPDEIRLAQAFADQAALALENARLYQNVQQAYLELSHTQAQMVRGETLRAMGELASGVAHHLNNLLAVVLGRLQLARGRHPGPEVDRHLELAERAALDGAEVVRRMRGFSRGQPAADLAPVDLNEVAAEVIELTRPRWQDEAQMRGIRIETRLLAGAIPEVAGEVTALREVLMNLILNAIDALPGGGAITVRTWAVDDAAHCEVGDTGTGMTPDVQRRALEPFFTTKGFQSTGLGLSVNYGIIRRHGGELTIESTPGLGTRVVFRLPTRAAGGARPTPRKLTPVTSPLRILVVDDEQEVRNVVAEILGAQGHEVVQAAGGAEGLACLDHDGSFDLVLTDLGMPGMTGWEVARAAKSRRPSVQVGLLTGWGEQPAAKAEERAAADFVLAKPITVDGLRAALATVRGTRV